MHTASGMKLMVLLVIFPKGEMGRPVVSFIYLVIPNDFLCKPLPLWACLLFCLLHNRPEQTPLF